MIIIIKKSIKYYLDRVCRKTDDMTRIRERVYPKIWQKDYHVLRFINRNIRSVLRSHNLYNKEILDLGCGLKPYASLMKSSDYIGVDSGAAAAMPDIVADLNNPLKLNRLFDVVTMFDSIEHIKETGNVLNIATGHLKTGGYLLISAPFFYFVHGGPYDFYRFTHFYYQELDSINLDLLSIKSSNTVLSSFLLLANNLLWYPIPIPYFMKYPIYFLINIICLCIDFVFNNLALMIQKSSFDEFIYSSPLEYFVVYRKK